MTTSSRALFCTALGHRGSGPAPVLEMRETPRQTLPAGHVRLRIRAAGLNFFDHLMLHGEYQLKPPLPFVPGAEASGTLVEVADDVALWRPGDDVVAAMRLGAFAEEAVIPAGSLLRKPPALSFPEAAAFPVAAATAWIALHVRGGLQAGEWLLVLGAGGGMGPAAVALGRRMQAHVLALASSAEKRQAALRAGAHLVLDPEMADWPEAVRQATHNRGADVIFDPVGGQQFTAAWRALATSGRYLVIGFASGDAPRVAANRLLLREANLIGVRAGEQLRRVPGLRQPQQEALSAWLAEGSFRPHVGECFPLHQAEKALERIATRQAVGKVVLVNG